MREIDGNNIQAFQPNTAAKTKAYPQAQTVWQLMDILKGMDPNAQVIGPELGGIIVVPQISGSVLVADA